MKSLTEFILENRNDIISKEEMDRFIEIMNDWAGSNKAAFLKTNQTSLKDTNPGFNFSGTTTGLNKLYFEYLFDKPVTIKAGKDKDDNTLIRFDRRWDPNHEKTSVTIYGWYVAIYKNESGLYKWEVWLCPIGSYRGYRRKYSSQINYGNGWRPLRVVSKTDLEGLLPGKDVIYDEPKANVKMTAQKFFEEIEELFK